MAPPGGSGALPPRLGIVVGLRAEARIAARLTEPGLVAISGATAEGARRAATALAARGVDALMSFGLAAGLDPRLRPGTLLVPAAVRVGPRRLDAAPLLAGRLPRALVDDLLHADTLVTEPREKALLFDRTGCGALDMESGAVALAAHASDLPFVVLRAVCDPAECRLPHAAALPLGADGRVALARILRSVVRHPSQIPDLVRLGRYVRTASGVLRREVGALRGPMADAADPDAAGGAPRTFRT